ncbi:MAG TPA: DUF3300 domain-containing protein [Terriglobales bacterium]|nr:DUF3300 domain-containing protein [Terriglobales bacterium]
MRSERWTFRSPLAILCSIALLPGDTLADPLQSAAAPVAAPQSQRATIPADQLDSLVAPIALYPDPLLAQVLAASTYPLELIQLQQWITKNKNLKDKALADAVSKQPWDPSVQALAALPDVVNRLANDIQWTTDLGNAFLAQQNDLMNAVQRMRKKAKDKGSLKSTEQQVVETRVVEKKEVIVIEQANPQVVYVPSYDPVVVWGAAPYYYPYPPIYYPPAGYYAAGMALSFGVGVMMGAFWGGGWGWGCGWGGNNDITINRNNNFNRNSNIGGGNRNNIGGGNRPSQLPSGGRGNAGNRGNLGGAGGNRASQLPANASGKWQHNPSHRGGAPYRDRATADKFGGTARGDSLSRRQASARQQVGRQGGNLSSSRSGGGAGAGNRAGGSAGGGSFGSRGGNGAGNRSSGGFGSSGLGGSPERIGSRDLSRSGGQNRDAFGGGTRGYSGSNARSSSSRGSSSFGSRGGGGFSGGGSRGGGRRR